MRTKEEIIEGNKLIAEFMGYEKTIYSDVFNGDLYALDVSKGEIYAISQMQYHASWDWIMPVVEKIEQKGCIVEISYSLVCMCRICVIWEKHKKAFNIINDNNGGLEPIIAIYKSVVEFIKWYNQNTK